ncbi:hypothetical protein K1719_036853 [Acacia pycnantha]|nr:hypothetical protein K1719_036853 [Acacia pycnantha]
MSRSHEEVNMIICQLSSAKACWLRSTLRLFFLDGLHKYQLTSLNAHRIWGLLCFAIKGCFILFSEKGLESELRSLQLSLERKRERV